MESEEEGSVGSERGTEEAAAAELKGLSESKWPEVPPPRAAAAAWRSPPSVLAAEADGGIGTIDVRETMGVKNKHKGFTGAEPAACGSTYRFGGPSR